MPKKARERTPAEIRRLGPGLHAVGGVDGLLLRVKPSGARHWVLRTMIGAKRRDVGLGGHPTVTLAEAREKARAKRAQIEAGLDPIEERRAARAALIAEQADSAATEAKGMTFAEAARQCHAVKSREFRNPKHAAQWMATIEAYANPVIGALPVARIELAHVVKILEPLWTEKTETATRLRQRIETVLTWATVRGYREGDNPARWRGNLDAVLPKPGKVAKVQHHRALPIEELPGFMEALRKRDGIAARALEFAILTATRSGEVRGATDDEFDLDAAVWTIPAGRMKAEREHRVPLSPRAVELIKSAPRFQGSPFVFPAQRGGQLSDMALTQVLRRMEVDAVPHGFRSTFRDWCAERTAYPAEVAEMALAHVIENKTEAAYRRGDLFDKRRRMMDDWTRFCAAPVADGSVAPIRAARAESA